MNGDSVQLVPNIPPLGLRDVPETCIVCAITVENKSARNTLRIRLSQGGRTHPALVIGYACRACYADRRHEVHSAQFAEAQRYLLIQRH